MYGKTYNTICIHRRSVALIQPKERIISYQLESNCWPKAARQLKLLTEDTGLSTTYIDRIESVSAVIHVPNFK